MTELTTNPAPDTAILFDAASKPSFNTHLSFYHANAKNTGSAIQFSIEPASPDRDGAVFLSIARQKTVATNEGDRRFASFDWVNKITVKLNFVEVAELMMVLAGHASQLAHAGKEGLFHNSPSATTTINFKRADDPARPGFLLAVGRSPKADPDSRQFVSFTFWPAEAFGLRLALMMRMGAIAFGISRIRAQPGGALSPSSSARTSADPFALPTSTPAVSSIPSSEREVSDSVGMERAAPAFADDF